MIRRLFLAILIASLTSAAEARIDARGTNVGPWYGGQLIQQNLTTLSGTPGASVAATINGVTAGNALLVAFDTCMSTNGSSCDCNGQACATRPITSIAGSGGTCVRGTGPTTGYNPIELWVCSNVTAGNKTLTLNLTAATGGAGDYLSPNVRVMEVTAAASALEGAVSNSSQNVFGTGSFPAQVSTNGNVAYNDFVYSKGTAGPFTQVGWPGQPFAVLAGCDGTHPCEVIVPGASYGPYNIVYNGSNLNSIYDAAVIVLKGPPAISPQITGADVTNSFFVGGSPDGTVVGAVQVAMVGAPFSGTLALSGANAANFRLSATTLPSNLLLNGTQGGGTFNLNIVPTQAGASNSAVARPIVIKSSFAPPWGPTPGLALWYDPSEPTTTFTDTGCTTNSHVTGATIKCIKDKSPSACHATNSTGWLLTNTGGKWFLSGAASGSVLACAVGIFQNVGYANVHFAGTPASDSQMSPFSATINEGGFSGSSKLYCGVDASSLTGKGFGVRLRRLDTDSGVNVEAGTYVGALKAVSCRVAYAGASSSVAVFVNNASVASNASVFTPGGLTSNTPSDQVGWLQTPNLAGSVWSGPIYGLVVDTPATAPTGALENAIDSYLCTQAGLTC